MRHGRWIPSVIACLVLWSSTPSADQDVIALSGFEYVLDGRSELVGVAVREDGTRFVSDRGAGVVYRITSTGTLVTAATGLDRPAGLALDTNQSLLIAEESAGRLLRLESGGQVTTLAAGIKTPRWIAVDPSGFVYVSAHRLTPPDGTDPSEGRVIIRVAPDGTMAEVATGIRSVEGLLVLNGGLIVASRGPITGPGNSGVLLRYPVNPDGTLGLPAELATTGLKQPKGIAADALGAVYVSSKELLLEQDRLKRAIAKVQAGHPLSDFASNLFDPQGLALGPDGSLYAADGLSGRLYRFRAPTAPVLNALPEFTKQQSVAVTGTTEVGAKATVFLDDAEQGSAVVDSTGHFSVDVTLHPNTLNEITVIATPYGGRGLTSPPAAEEVTHDGIGPTVTFIAPAASYVRETTSVQVRVADSGSGVSAVTLSAGDQNLSPSLAPAPPAAELIASASWDTRTVADGTHTLRATATDRATNTATATRTVVVDNTPPTTTITGGPSGTTAATAVTFTFTGTDNLTMAANLVFAWRLDSAAFDTFSSTTSATFNGLATGAHTFEVKARDQAGNESSVAARSFTVGSSVQVMITAPANGAIVPAGMLLVQGTVDASGAEVGVIVNSIPAAVQGNRFATLVPVDAATTALIATATSTNGSSATSTSAVIVSAAQSGTIRATPSVGIAPLSVGFVLSGAPAGALIDFDFDGDGRVDVNTTSEPNFVYLQPGLYFPSASFTDNHGVRQTVRTVAQVYDSSGLGTLLQARWTALKDSLRRGDIPQALTNIVARARPQYEAMFNDLRADLLNIDNILTTFTVLELRRSEAICEMLRPNVGFVESFEIRFLIDDDGVWRLAAF